MPPGVLISNSFRNIWIACWKSEWIIYPWIGGVRQNADKISNDMHTRDKFCIIFQTSSAYSARFCSIDQNSDLIYFRKFFQLRFFLETRLALQSHSFHLFSRLFSLAFFNIYGSTSPFFCLLIPQIIARQKSISRS